MEKNYVVTSLDDLRIMAKEVLSHVSNFKSDQASVITLNGDLGAGKTAFVKELAQLLDVTEVVSSPTFVIQKQYATQHDSFSLLVHMDAYRIEEESELLPLNFIKTVSDASNLVCIEWPDKIKMTLNNVKIAASVEFIYEGETRYITVRYGKKE